MAFFLFLFLLWLPSLFLFFILFFYLFLFLTRISSFSVPTPLVYSSLPPIQVPTQSFCFHSSFFLLFLIYHSRFFNSPLPSCNIIRLLFVLNLDIFFILYSSFLSPLLPLIRLSFFIVSLAFEFKSL